MTLTEAAAKHGLLALQGMFPGLAAEPDPGDKHFTAGDDLRLVGRVVFTSGGADDRPLLECDYGVKVIVPRAFPRSLPRVYSTDGQIQEDYHTFSTGELCLGAPLELRTILQQEPTLLGYITGALVPYLYRHQYTIAFDAKGPPGWEDLKHGSHGLLQYYGDKLGVSDYIACVALLHQAGMRQQKKGRRVRCPCGSGMTLFECHYEQMLALRSTVGRDAVWRAYLHLKSLKAPPPNSPAPKK